MSDDDTGAGEGKRMDRCGDSLRISDTYLMVTRKDGSQALVYQNGTRAVDRPQSQNETIIAELCEVIEQLRKDRE